jgi:hypothetical protein
MERSILLASWQSGDLERLPELLAEHATFSSPVTDYRGRREAAHILRLIADVLEDVENTGEWSSEDETVCAFAARVNGDHVEGMLREQRDERGRLVHVTLFLRPYRALRTAIQGMREQLATNPLPGSPA